MVFVNMQAAWSGVCIGGLAEGTGEFTLVWGIERNNRITLTGFLQQGKQQGRWVEHYEDGTVEKGQYVEGERHGQWVHRRMDGNVVKKTYMASKLL